VKRRVTLQIHREDHKVDAIGLIFLEALERERCLEVLRAYLGAHARLRHVEVDDDVVRVEADVREFAEESQNLVRLAREMMRAGRTRSALGQLEEALRLAPWHPQALKTLGRLYYRQRRAEEAAYYLTRAREVSPDDVDVLRLLAEIALHTERPLQARAYLEKALAMRPNERRVRAALSRLLPEEARRSAGGPTGTDGGD
jgi:cytochrome c-type biogenesis protein CcmH/NrfG